MQHPELPLLRRASIGHLHPCCEGPRQQWMCRNSALFTSCAAISTSVKADAATASTRSSTSYHNFSSLSRFNKDNRSQRFSMLRSRISMSALDKSSHGSTTANSNSLSSSDEVSIYRKDMEGGSSRAFPLSIDVPLKKFTDMFSDFDAKRCSMCNETFMQWGGHQQAVPHAGREALMLEMVRAFCGTPEEIVQRWWRRLDTDPSFARIPSLSHANSHERKRRLQFLLRLLKDRRVLVDSFEVNQHSGAGRSWEFERLEWAGDNVVKYVFNNRFNCLFPVKEGGIRGRLGYGQFVIDGNEGLARAYDYLELQQLTCSDRVVSKFKSDVVETMFGEMQLYLWSTEMDLGTSTTSFPFSPDLVSLRAVVAHVMEELAHVMFMFHAEFLLGILQRVVREHDIQYVRADPSLRGQVELQQELAGSFYSSKKSQLSISNTATFTRNKVSPPHQHHGASVYLASMSYDIFQRVVPLGGLLPRSFAADELAPVAAFLPHLQRITKPQTTHLTETQEGGPTSSASCTLPLQPRATPQPTGRTPPPLTINELKDEELIAELA